MQGSSLIVLVLSLLKSVDAQSCANATDCNTASQFCADGTCLSLGDCQVDIDCYNPENNYASIDCVGYTECMDGSCVKTCGDSFCPPDASEVICDGSGCVSLRPPGSVWCIENNCGGCNTYFLDAKGSEIPKEVTDPGSCNQNDDCRSEGILDDDMEFPYCGAGVCLAAGSCNTDVDCINPSNRYPLIECVGPVVCGADGFCTRDCDVGSLCPEGVTLFQCLNDPCSYTSCPTSVSCFSDYCGDCNANHFNLAGHKIENCGNTDCVADSDCPERSYCAAGTCLPTGKCKITEDCLNPSNYFETAQCTGYLECTSDGQCSKVCSIEEHCCFVPLCSNEDKEACPEGVSCVADNCNKGESNTHCNLEKGIVHYDEAGNEVCMDETPDLPEICNSDADCSPTAVQRSNSLDKPYCAQGNCLSAGACNSDLDCFNPANNYAVIECEGYVQCGSNGMCGVECGSMCQSGAAFSTCEQTPCENTQVDGAVSCANDFCDGCNAIHFDSAGNKITEAVEPSAAESNKEMISVLIATLTLAVNMF